MKLWYIDSNFTEAKGPIKNKPASVQIMAWCVTGDKPLSEPVMAKFGDAYMHQSTCMIRRDIYVTYSKFQNGGMSC